MSSLVLGIILIIDGTFLLLYGDFFWRGTIVPSWTGGPQILFGLVFCVYGIWSLWRKKGQPKERIYTAEELAQAEAEADALYFREHGEMPQKPKSDTEHQ